MARGSRQLSTVDSATPKPPCIFASHSRLSLVRQNARDGLRTFICRTCVPSVYREVGEVVAQESGLVDTDSAATRLRVLLSKVAATL